MSATRDIPCFDIWVTQHARDRARERCGLKGARIVDEVRDAIRAGNVSAWPPTGVKYTAQHPRVLYVWNDERCYPLKLMPGDDIWMVTTVVPRETQGALARPVV